MQKIAARSRKSPTPAGKRFPSVRSALDPLVVWESLEIGPVRIEPRRLVAPYTVRSGGRSESTELIYRYEEKVFDRKDPASVNMASMISAQVALNYGLFAKRMVFHGPFDAADRRFLEDMAENTSREIYVKKFLEPNPFILGKAASLTAVKMKRYTRAKLVFPGSPAAGRSIAWLRVSADPEKYAVLSSGGKDSLLTYGLIGELGFKIDPVYINESGRHWFTALNAYRHFRENVPGTSRVWINSDRIFAWMLRRLPFVRRDFADVRSDEYAIRLWTVAVFLFGALPLARKRGIGRILIGDEYDTTQRSSRRGITHYNGLYDQSRWFDDALTRYYARKGWPVRQLSILRPLSEMLIEKILVERYPDLQTHQVSCHATHKEGERVHPCGYCEKCRRIVGMLLAIGADPRRCGYSGSQIEECLRLLVERGVHQESAGARQLLLMLSQKGLIGAHPPDLGSPAGHPEILRLRFDPVRAPADYLPPDIRDKLHAIFLEHSGGAVRWSGGRWRRFDPLK